MPRPGVVPVEDVPPAGAALGPWEPVLASGRGSEQRGVGAVPDRGFSRLEVFFPGKLV